jgi:heme-degrading monooxygenase HmoA
MKAHFRSLAVVVALALTGMPAIAAATALEVVSAPVANGVTVEQMHTVDAPIWKTVAAMPGFISRETGVSAQDEWFVIVHWKTLDDAEAAAKALNPKPEAAAMMKALKADPIFFRHYIVQE